MECADRIFRWVLLLFRLCPCEDMTRRFSLTTKKQQSFKSGLLLHFALKMLKRYNFFGLYE